MLQGTGINRGGLYITQTQFQHAGEYRCVAKSTSGIVSRTASLTVIGPPSEPAGVFGGVTTARTIELSWWPGTDHGRPIKSYTVEAQNTQEGFWKKAKASMCGIFYFMYITCLPIL